MSSNRGVRKIKQTNSENISSLPHKNQQDNQNEDRSPEEPQVQYKNILLEALKILNKNNTKSQKGEQLVKQNTKKDEIDQEMQLLNMPQPLQSQEEHSKEVEYLSYMPNLILEDEENSKQSQNQEGTQREKLRGVIRQQFLSILYECVIYVKKQDIKTKIDDDLIMDRLCDHLISSIPPKPKSLIGHALLRNGYAISAYSIAAARLHSSPSILTYLFNFYNENISQIQENREQFLHYTNKQIETFTILSKLPLRLSKDQERVEKSEFFANSERLGCDKQNLKRVNTNHYKISKNQSQQNENEEQDTYGCFNKMKSTIASISEPKSIFKKKKQDKEKKL